MNEILALQAALATAQEKKSSIRLSESNVIELVNKLKSLDLLSNTLLYTLNGKEYLTEDRLDQEIKREVRKSGGRVQVTDLQPALNVDVVHCERRARALALDKTNEIDLVEGELITPKYFDTIAREVDEELREAGVVQVGNLARRHGLSADLMSKALSQRIQSAIIAGRMESGSVYTPEYVRRLKAQLRGAMRAALVPTTRDTLVNNALRQSDRCDVANAALTGAVLGDLAKEGKGKAGAGSNGSKNVSPVVVADGALRGGAWHPAVYSRAQTAAVAELYHANGMITVEQAKRMGVEDCDAYFKSLDGREMENKKKGVLLPESFVSASVVEQFDSAVRDSLAENHGWCECDSLLPVDLPASDARFLLSVISAVDGGGDAKNSKNISKPSKKKEKTENVSTENNESVARVVKGAQGLVACATPSFFDRVRFLASELGTARGKEEGTQRQLANRSMSSNESVSPTDTQKPEPKQSDTKTQKGKKKNSARDDDGSDGDDAFTLTTEDLDSDDDDRGKKGKGKGKGKKAGKGKSGSAAKDKKGSEKTQGGKSKTNNDDENAPDSRDLEHVIRGVAGGASDLFLEAVASDVLQVCQNAFAKAMTDTVASASAESAKTAKATRSAASEKFDELYPSACAFSRGSELLKGDLHAQAHCAFTKIIPAADAFLISRAECDIPDITFDAKNTITLTKQQRDTAKSGFPKHARDAASALVKEINNSSKDPKAILIAIDALHEDLTSEHGHAQKIKGSDRKTERSVTHVHKKNLEASFAEATGSENFASAFSVCVPLLLCIGKGRAVTLTGRSLSAALDQFDDVGAVCGAVTKDDLALLKKYHLQLVASLSDTSDESKNDLGPDAIAELQRIVSACEKVPEGGQGGDE